jgi:hypothetical protein
MKNAKPALVIGILLLALGVFIWQINGEHVVDRGTGYLTTYRYETIPADSTGQAIGLAIGVVGLGSTIVGLITLTKKQN